MNIVQGKSYRTDEPIGRALWEKVNQTLLKYQWMERQPDLKSQLVEEPLVAGEYREVLSRVRVGQSTFRTLITDAYQRRCAISGEKTLPVLEAAHIKPYAESGPHAVKNGLLLRSDIHKLFDSGYITVTPDYRIEVSSRIREEFENGRDYYKFEGQKLEILPSQLAQQPDITYLDWHNTNRFNG
jgi:putative restriction endonuclease